MLILGSSCASLYERSMIQKRIIDKMAAGFPSGTAALMRRYR